jgi:hypothetical protein
MIRSLKSISIQCRTSTPLSVTLDRVFSIIKTNDKLSKRRHPERSRRIVGVIGIKGNQNKYKTKIIILTTLLLSFQPLSTFSLSADSTKIFPLNDPRNPNCPCHKYQKLADEEYKRMLGEQQIQVANNVVQTSNTNVTASSGTISSKNANASHKLKRKKISARQKKFKRLVQVKNWKIFRRWKDPTACFKWR